MLSRPFLPTAWASCRVWQRDSAPFARKIQPFSGRTRSRAAPTRSLAATALWHAMASFNANPQVSPGPREGENYEVGRIVESRKFFLIFKANKMHAGERDLLGQRGLKFSTAYKDNLTLGFLSRLNASTNRSGPFLLSACQQIAP